MSGFELATSSISELRINEYVSDAAAVKIAIGDVVVITGTASATGIPEVKQISGTNPWVAAITGVVVGIKPNFATENFSSTGVAASTAATLLVCDDPRALYEVESDATLVVADVGLNVDIISTEATLSGVMYRSNYKLDGSSVVTTAATPVRVVKLLKGATTGTLGDRALVRFNETTDIAGAAGV